MRRRNRLRDNFRHLTFPCRDTTQTFAVTVCRDAVFEANETFTVDLSAPTNATISDGSGLGTITNDDTAPTLAINDVTAAEGTAREPRRSPSP